MSPEIVSKSSEKEFHLKPYESDDDDSDSDSDCGGVATYYDRDDPRLCTRPKYSKSMAELALDFYNKEHSENYRVVEVIELYAILACEGDCLCMNFSAKLDDSDDVVLFEAYLVEGLFDGTTRVEYVKIVELTMKEQHQQQLLANDGMKEQFLKMMETVKTTDIARHR